MEDIPSEHFGMKWYKRALYLLSLLVVLAVISLILFIKLDTANAANFTDQVLRPLIGDSHVTAMEEMFFTISDKINQIKYSVEKPKSPNLTGTTEPVLLSDSAVRASNLNLSQVTIATSNTPLDGEGQWHNIPLTVFPNQIVTAETFVRPDASRPYAFVTLLQMDMSKLQLLSVAGTAQEDQKTGTFGTGVVPQSVQGNGTLVAAFEGGFLFRNGHYGMIVGSSTYESLKKGLATIVGHKDGRIEIVSYEGHSFGSDVSFIRQNASMLIENNIIKAQDNGSTTMKLWGHSRSGTYYTWRSAVGITQKGNLIYAAGNSLVPSTLASALQTAGAVNAMQLDINPNWVRFNTFNNYTNETYTSGPIMEGMPDGSHSFLHGYGRDFFYVTKK